MIAASIIVGLVVCFTAWAAERRWWNRGTCRKCGNLWRYFDTDSQGGRGYACRLDHTTWVSWPGIDS